MARAPQLAPPASGSPGQDRAEMGRNLFAAVMFAFRNDCNCQACVLLRKAVEELMQAAMMGVTPDVPGLNPPTQ